MTRKSGTLDDFEEIIARSLAGNMTSVCAPCRCARLARAASDIAEEVTDGLAYEWGGQMVYFYMSGQEDAYADREGPNLGAGFLDTAAKLLQSFLQPGEPGSCCTGCSKAHGDWTPVISRAVQDLRTALAGQQFYIPFDLRRRNRMICREFTGDNVHLIARRHRIASATVYRILASSRAVNRTEAKLPA